MKTTAEMIEVMQAYERGEVVEVKRTNGWLIVTAPYWNWQDREYRIALKSKPSIDWSHVSEEYKWLATDSNGYTFLYFDEPHLQNYGWEEDWDSCDARTFASFQPGTCDWKDSLVQRPE